MEWYKVTEHLTGPIGTRSTEVSIVPSVANRTYRYEVHWSEHCAVCSKQDWITLGAWSAPRFNGTSAEWHSCSTALQLNCTAVPLHCSWMAPRFNGTTGKWHRGSTALQLNGTAVERHRSWAVLLFDTALLGVEELSYGTWRLSLVSDCRTLHESNVFLVGIKKSKQTPL